MIASIVAASLQKGANTMHEVPRVLHFIVMNSSMTAATAALIERWVTRNPGWTAYVWCDPATLGANHAVVAAQAPNVQVRVIEVNAVPGTVSVSHAAASDALRYLILQNHGGCFIDTDVEPGDPLPALSVSPSS